MAAITFRDTLRKISPPWLQRGNAEKILYAIGVQLDALGDALVAGVKLRFPGLYSNESLFLLGRERRIRRGRTETDAVYASRLIRWLDDHRMRGGPYALLAQLHAHYAPAAFPIDLVYRSGRRYRMDADGNVVRDMISWNPDANTAKWARWWLFYHLPDALPAGRVWGSGTYSSARVWGSGLSPQEVSDFRLVPREWGNAHSFGRIVLLPPGARLWGYPPRTWGTGTWGAGRSVSLSVGG